MDEGEQLGGDSFVSEGFLNWKKKDRLQIHVGGPNSAHNQAWNQYEALKNQNQHIQTIIVKQSDQTRIDYRKRLTASIDCIRYLLEQGLAFRGHDESEHSSNQGNFFQLLKFLANHNEDVKSDIVNVVAIETINVISSDIGDELFSIMIDESRDISTKEQMAVVFRYMDMDGNVIEHFIVVEHVTSTTALSLKMAIDELFCKHELSITRLRGQGYDGASNMQGEFNGLKTLILKENKCAFYVHCFAHQLQLALVKVAKSHVDVTTFFSYVANVVNVVGASCKRRDILHEKQATMVIEALNNGEIESGRGLNQNTILKRASDTRWGSHYDTLISLISMFSSVIDVLEIIIDDGSYVEQRSEAKILLTLMQSFGFVFTLHLMRVVLGVTNELSKALQKKNQDIVNAMSLIKVYKKELQMMRENGWDSLLDQVSSFCEKYGIEVPNMNDTLVTPGRSRRKANEITNLHYYHVQLFYAVLDMQLQELNSRFSESNTELLICISCLCPDDSFASFDKEN
ncbi:uncharacterized protein LOC132305013 [Cornus florida]|uniref:uncharacterized protein LOC132305013 n=1 Tax=Cornus florida TaxID=4283 RepID=UPI0028A0E646|nr:uncharacterized protein LOC132305013 [Cornus florida]